MTRIWFLLPTVCLLAAACSSADAGSPMADPGATPSQPSENETADPSAVLAPPVVGSSPAVQSPAEEYSNRIKWKTASELNNYGYDVYRGAGPDGPFERITSDVIEGAGTTDEPSAYEYIDRTIDPYKTYYYYVESISMDGVRERFTPIGKAKPKLSVEGDEAIDEPGNGSSDSTPSELG